MQRVVTGHTFALDAVCAGDTDLFIVLPADDRRTEIAPYVRWLLASLFSTVRRTPVAERVIVAIDEAFVLARFDAILRGAGELPGYGVSLWTFWQSEAQMVEAYGQAGLRSCATPPVIMLFNLSMAQGEERERWSKALGTFTGVQETVTTDPATGKVSRSSTAVGRSPGAGLGPGRADPAAYAGVPQQPGAHHRPAQAQKDARPRRRALHRAARLREAGARDRLWPARTVRDGV